MTEENENFEEKAKSEGTKLYVGNLPFSVTLEDLKKVFSPYGEITDAIVMSDKFTGRSKGFGFVTFAKNEDAEKAISELNEKDVQGRNIKVSVSKPFDPSNSSRPRRDFGDRPKRNFSGGNNRRY